MYPLLLRRRFARPTLIGWGSAATLAGIALAALGPVLTGYWWLLGVGGLVLLAYRRTWAALLCVVIAGLLLGLWRGSLEQMRLAEVGRYVGQAVVLRGTVAADPEATRQGNREARLRDVVINGRAVAGTVLVTIPADAGSVARGDSLQVSGKLKPGFGTYQAKISYVSDMRVTPGELPEVQVRDAFAGSVRQSIREPEASLGLGFLLGQRSALPADTEENFKLLGLTHIVVASGYNLTILVRLARRSLEKVSKFQATAASLGLVAGFVLVTGFSSSMTRAALVTVLAVWAWHYGRKIHPALLLVFAAAVTALWNPLYVWADVGWYLSFLAFAGVLLLAPLVTRRLYDQRDPSSVMQIVIETLCAQAMTLPLILLLFGVLPVLSLPANVLVVPFIPLAMLLTFGVGLIGAVLPALGWMAGVPAQLILSYVVTVSEVMAATPGVSLELSFGAAAMLLSYLIVVLIALSLWRKTRYDFLQRSFIE